MEPMKQCPFKISKNAKNSKIMGRSRLMYILTEHMTSSIRMSNSEIYKIAN